MEKSELYAMDFMNAIYELESTVLRQPRVDVLARGNEVISTRSTSSRNQSYSSQNSSEKHLYN